jgi:hypothetical protein
MHQAQWTQASSCQARGLQSHLVESSSLLGTLKPLGQQSGLHASRLCGVQAPPLLPGHEWLPQAAPEIQCLLPLRSSRAQPHCCSTQQGQASHHLLLWACLLHSALALITTFSPSTLLTGVPCGRLPCFQVTGLWVQLSQ